MKKCSQGCKLAPYAYPPRHAVQNVRKEIREFVMCANVLLYGQAMEKPLTVEEVTLIELYITRISEKHHLPFRHSDSRQEPIKVNGEETEHRNENQY